MIKMQASAGPKAVGRSTANSGQGRWSAIAPTRVVLLALPFCFMPALRLSPLLCSTCTAFVYSMEPVREGLVLALAFSPDGTKLASGDSNGCICLFDGTASRQLATFPKQEEAIYGLTFSPDGQTMATGDFGGLITLWKKVGESYASVRQMRQKHEVRCMAWAPRGGRLAIGSGGGRASAALVTIWDTQSGVALRSWDTDKDVVCALCYGRSGRVLVTGGLHGTVRVWDAETGREIGPAFRSVFSITAVAAAPHGDLIAVATGGGDIGLWHIDEDHKYRSVARGLGLIESLAFTPDGRLLVAADCVAEEQEQSVHFWKVATGQEVGSGIRGNVRNIAVSPDGKTLATAGLHRDCAIKTWNLDELVK